MPFKSQAQRAYMYSQHPDIAQRWRKESGPQRGLPDRAGKPTGKHRRRRTARDDKRQRLIQQFLAKQRQQQR